METMRQDCAILSHQLCGGERERVKLRWKSMKILIVIEMRQKKYTLFIILYTLYNIQYPVQCTAVK